MKYRIKRKENRYIPQKKKFLLWESFNYVTNDSTIYNGKIIVKYGINIETKKFDSVKHTENGYWCSDGYGHLAFNTFDEAFDFIKEYKEWATVEKTVVIK